jgi:hypothetical protein
MDDQRITGASRANEAELRYRRALEMLQARQLQNSMRPNGLAPLRPLIKRCACRCGQRISDNKMLTLACRKRLAAEAEAKRLDAEESKAKEQVHGETDISSAQEATN